MLGKVPCKNILPQEGVFTYVPEISSGAKSHIPPRNESRRDWWVEGTTHGSGATVRMEEIKWEQPLNLKVLGNPKSIALALPLHFFLSLF